MKPLERLLEEGKATGRGKTRFLDADPKDLPPMWNVPAKGPPKGDFRITEYVDGDELFLTTYDCAGLFHRIHVLEFQKKLLVVVPR